MRPAGLATFSCAVISEEATRGTMWREQAVPRCQPLRWASCRGSLLQELNLFGMGSI